MCVEGKTNNSPLRPVQRKGWGWKMVWDRCRQSVNWLVAECLKPLHGVRDLVTSPWTILFFKGAICNDATSGHFPPFINCFSAFAKQRSINVNLDVLLHHKIPNLIWTGFKLYLLWGIRSSPVYQLLLRKREIDWTPSVFKGPVWFKMGSGIWIITL